MSRRKHNPLFAPPVPVAFFTRVEWRRAALYQPCAMCGRPGRELCLRFKGAHSFPPVVYCAGCAMGISHKLLGDGTLTVVRERAVRRS